MLSACQTGLGSGALADVPAGDDWVGLTRAFLHAGARQVVATLWPVDDRATAALMERFYEGYAGGAGPARSLAGAQRELLGPAAPRRIRSTGRGSWRWAAPTREEGCRDQAFPRSSELGAGVSREDREVAGPTRRAVGVPGLPGPAAHPRGPRYTREWAAGVRDHRFGAGKCSAVRRPLTSRRAAQPRPRVAAIASSTSL